MEAGMMWYCTDEKPEADKVREAAQYFRDKYGEKPTVCYVKRGRMDVGKKIPPVDGIE